MKNKKRLLTSKVRLFCIGFLALLSINQMAWPINFAQSYNIIFNGNKVGTLERQVLNGADRQPFVNIILTLSTLSQNTPDTSLLYRQSSRSGIVSFSDSLQHIYNMGAKTTSDPDKSTASIKIHYDHNSLQHDFCLPTTLSMSLTEGKAWSYKFNIVPEKVTLSGPGSGETTFHGIGDGSIEEMEKANIPAGATPSSNSLVMLPAALAEVQSTPTENFPLIMFGLDQERCLNQLVRQRHTTTQATTIISPFSLLRGGRAKNTNRGAATLYFIGGFGQRFVYDRALNQIIQQDPPYDPYPSHIEVVYQLNPDGLIESIQITDSHNNFTLTFQADQPGGQQADESQALITKHNPDKDGKKDDGNDDGVSDALQELTINTVMMEEPEPLNYIKPLYESLKSDENWGKGAITTSLLLYSLFFVKTSFITGW